MKTPSESGLVRPDAPLVQPCMGCESPARLPLGPFLFFLHKHFLGNVFPAAFCPDLQRNSNFPVKGQKQPKAICL